MSVPGPDGAYSAAEKAMQLAEGDYLVFSQGEKIVHALDRMRDSQMAAAVENVAHNAFLAGWTKGYLAHGEATTSTD